MDAMFSAEQINVPPEFGPILKQYAKAVLRAQPNSNHIYQFSANFFADLAGIPPIFDASTGRLISAPIKEKLRPSESAVDVSDVLGDADRFESVPTAQTFERSDERVDAIFAKYNKGGSNKVQAEGMNQLLQELVDVLEISAGEDRVRQVLSLIDTDEQGQVDLMELRELFFRSNE